MSAKKYPAKAVAELRVMRHAKCSYPEMASALNERWQDEGIEYTAACCRGLLRRDGGAPTPLETWRDEVVETLEKMHWDGMSYAKIAVALATQFGGKYTHDTVHRAAEVRSFQRNPDRQREIERRLGTKKPPLTVEDVATKRLSQRRAPEVTEARFPGQRYPVPPGGFSMLRGAGHKKITGVHFSHCQRPEIRA